MIECDREIKAREPDIAVVNKNERSCAIDIAVPGDIRVSKKEKEETETVCSYHVTYAFQSESTLYSCLNVKELLAWPVWLNG